MTTSFQVDRPRDIRIAVGAMIGAAAIWPLLPATPGLPCPLRTTTGIPCPFCGMTRAVVAAVHGDFVESLQFNPLGIFIALLAIVIVLWPRILRARIPVWPLVVGGVLLWGYNITLNPTFT